ncbi:hypothetical protein C7401_102296 [Paraburkholderia unamae]|uniref:hypothetical protein n=1 Tax=Paraburkholderia unamae TaxID=219649 RepID=UPI000DC59E65|nr:hypothetical protein [Paraburkholderia unamae]RAR66871.1 hypothetical protein C7401_102296 [Paraburkholderia unamae]
MRNTVLKTLAAAAAVSLALAACGGGGGGGGGSSGSGSGTGTGTGTTTTSNGATLLAQYTVPADIAAAVVTNYSGPAFNVGNSGMQSNCANAALVSTTVVDAPDVVVFTTTASVKSQEVAADLFEQAVPQIRAALGLSTTGTGFDGTNKISLCIDPNLGTADGETGGGTSITGQTAQGPGAVIVQIMSPDSPNFDARYPGATSYTDGTVGLRYFDLFRHEGTHAALYSLAEPFGGMEAWFQEGMATTVAQLPMGSKASILAAVQATDLLPANGTAAGDMGTSYPAYEATISLLTSSAPGGLGFGLTNIPAFVATYKAKAAALCEQAIPAGLTPNANETAGMAAGQYNVCAPGAPGMVAAPLETAFDQAFSATFTSNGAPLLLHTADGADSLEATLYQRLSAFLP